MKKTIGPITRHPDRRFRFTLREVSRAGTVETETAYATISAADGLSVYTGDEHDVVDGLGVGWREVASPTEFSVEGVDRLERRARVERLLGVNGNNEEAVGATTAPFVCPAGHQGRFVLVQTVRRYLWVGESEDSPGVFYTDGETEGPDIVENGVLECWHWDRETGTNCQLQVRDGWTLEN